VRSACSAAHGITVRRNASDTTQHTEPMPYTTAAMIVISTNASVPGNTASPATPAGVISMASSIHTWIQRRRLWSVWITVNDSASGRSYSGRQATAPVMKTTKPVTSTPPTRMPLLTLKGLHAMQGTSPADHVKIPLSGCRFPGSSFGLSRDCPVVTRSKR